MSLLATQNWTTDEWLSFIGEQCRTARIQANLKQTDLAIRANVSVGAVKNLEAGKGSSLFTLVRVVRALGRSDWFEGLAPPISVSPMLLLKTKRRNASRMKVFRPRKRATLAVESD